jgi:hypothetical protein
MKIRPLEDELFMRMKGWTDGGTQTDRHTDRQTDRQSDGQRERHYQNNSSFSHFANATKNRIGQRFFLRLILKSVQKNFNQISSIFGCDAA